MILVVDEHHRTVTTTIQLSNPRDQRSLRKLLSKTIEPMSLIFVQRASTVRSATNLLTSLNYELDVLGSGSISDLITERLCSLSCSHLLPQTQSEGVVSTRNIELC